MLVLTDHRQKDPFCFRSIFNVTAGLDGGDVQVPVGNTSYLKKAQLGTSSQRV